MLEAELERTASSLTQVLAHQEIHDMELEGVRQQLKDTVDQLDNITHQLSVKEQAMEELNQVNQQTVILKETVMSLEADLKRGDARYVVIDNELSNCKAELAELALDLKNKKVAFKTIESEMRAKEVEIESLKRNLEEQVRLQQVESSESLNTSMSSSILEVSTDVAGALDVVAVAEALGTSTNAAAEALIAELTVVRKQLRERDDREGKLKQLTLKAKKEVAEYKNKLESSQKELESLRNSTQKTGSDFSLQYHGIQMQYDSLESAHDRLKAEKAAADLTLKQAAEELSRVKLLVAELTDVKERGECEMERLAQEKKLADNQRVEREQELNAERIQKQHVAKEKLEIQQQLKQLEEERQREGKQSLEQRKQSDEDQQREIKQLQDQLKSFREQLDHAKHEVSQTGMLDLEIAAYDRTVKGLHETLTDRDERIRSLQEELQRKEQQSVSLQKLHDTANSQYVQAEEHAGKLKQLLIKAKREISEAKKGESEQCNLNAQMKGKLEMLTQLTEEQKVEISRLVSNEHRLSERLGVDRDSQQRTMRSLEVRVASLEKELTQTKEELSTVQHEYDGYKVRVHSVLKQQKTRAADEVTVEQERADRQRAESLIEQLKVKLQQLGQQLMTLTGEHEVLQEEHERLGLRHTKLQVDSDVKERTWKEKLDRASAETTALTSSRV